MTLPTAILLTIGFVIAQAPFDAVTKAADMASSKSDRWHEDALLVIFLAAIFFLSKWGMKQLEARDSRITALQDQVGATKEKFAEFAIGQAQAMTAAVTHNSEVIQANTRQTEANTEVLNDMKSISRIQLKMVSEHSELPPGR